MKGLLWVLALFALAVGISLAAHVNDGYVLLVLPPYRAEISLNLAILLLLLGFAVLYAFLRAAALTLSLPRRVREFRARREREKSLHSFEEGVRLLFEGRYSQAMRKAAEAHASGHSAGLAALLAARAAQCLNEVEEQQAWLDRAMQEGPEMQSACLLLAAERHLEEQRFAEALDLLERLRKLAGKQIVALRLELKAQQGCGDWSAVLRVARDLEKHHALPHEQARAIKSRAHQENILQRRSRRQDVLDDLKALPADEHDLELDRRIAATLLELGAHREAAGFIEDRLEMAWDPSLVRLYGQVRGGDVTTRMALADRWLPQHRDDPQLLLALGRMCLEQRLWGKAQAYLDAALSVADATPDQREIRLELARLCEATERDAEAMAHYRAAGSFGE